jgi:hypothetical protein
MASFSNPPQRVKLMKTVKRAFELAGWKVHQRSDPSHEFLVETQDLDFLIKCLDESRIDYSSPTTIVTTIERDSRELRRLLNRQLVVIFDRNFLGIVLEDLMDRGIIAISLPEIEIVTGLAALAGGLPSTIFDPRQQCLLERCVNYDVALSKRYRANGNLEAAISWARLAVRHSATITKTHLYLLDLLKSAGEFEAATELGYEIRSHRPDDPEILQSMADLSRRQGDETEAARWTAQLAEPTTPRTFEAILAKQLQQSGQPFLGRLTTSTVESSSSKSRLLRLFGALARGGRG